MTYPDRMADIRESDSIAVANGRMHGRRDGELKEEGDIYQTNTIYRGIGNCKMISQLISQVRNPHVNSAGCKRDFSRFGIAHTNRRVRKTTIIKTDLQQTHTDSGLIHR